jgi:hypothetical protein
LSRRRPQAIARARLLGTLAALAAALALAACAAPASRPLTPLHQADVLWLERVDFGLDSHAVTEYRRLGREQYLAQQTPRAAARSASPVLNDYRALRGGLFRTLWSLTPAQCATIFPQVAPRDLNLI